MEASTNARYSQSSIKKGLALRCRYLRVSACPKLDRLGNKAHYICRLFPRKLFQPSSSKPLRLLRHHQGRQAKGRDSRIETHENLPLNRIKGIQHWGSNAWTLRNKVITHSWNFPKFITYRKSCQITWCFILASWFKIGSLASNCPCQQVW